MHRASVPSHLLVLVTILQHQLPDVRDVLYLRRNTSPGRHDTDSSYKTGKGAFIDASYGYPAIIQAFVVGGPFVGFPAWDSRRASSDSDSHKRTVRARLPGVGLPLLF